MGKTKNISVDELVAVVTNVRCCTMCSVAYVTPTDAINGKLEGGKQNAFYGRVKAINAVSGIQLFANYEKAVNNRLKGSGKKFEAEPLPWGEWLVADKLIQHKGKRYVRFYVTKSQNTDKVYFLDNERADSETATVIAANIRERKASTRQGAVGIKEKDMVKPFNLCIDNIVSLTLNGVTYNICHV